MLPNGAVVSGVSPHSFAFFRDLVEKGDLEIYKVNVQTEGSQFGRGISFRGIRSC
jgi:hypothetical protein